MLSPSISPLRSAGSTISLYTQPLLVCIPTMEAAMTLNVTSLSGGVNWWKSPFPTSGPSYSDTPQPIIIKNMIEEFQTCKVGYKEMLEMNLRQLFLMIQRTRLEKPPLVTTAVQQEMDFARQYFHEHYNEPINIEEYAQSRHTSIRLFMRNFKKVYGVSPKQYILNIRMNNAQNLLETTDYTVAEIAAIVGYDNALYFSRIYHKQKGQAPSDYRKKMKEQ